MRQGLRKTEETDQLIIKPNLFMKKTPNAYLNQPCERCGSKRFLSKAWKEVSLNDSGREISVEYTQVDCTDKACQKEFEKTQVLEAEKRKEIRDRKEANDLVRRARFAKARILKKVLQAKELAGKKFKTNLL